MSNPASVTIGHTISVGNYESLHPSVTIPFGENEICKTFEQARDKARELFMQLASEEAVRITERRVEQRAKDSTGRDPLPGLFEWFRKYFDSVAH